MTMTLAVLKKILSGFEDGDVFDDYTLVRDPENPVIMGIKIDERLKVIYI